MAPVRIGWKRRTAAVLYRSLTIAAGFTLVSRHYRCFVESIKIDVSKDALSPLPSCCGSFAHAASPRRVPPPDRRQRCDHLRPDADPDRRHGGRRDRLQQCQPDPHLAHRRRGCGERRRRGEVVRRHVGGRRDVGRRTDSGRRDRSDRHLQRADRRQDRFQAQQRHRQRRQVQERGDREGSILRRRSDLRARRARQEDLQHRIDVDRRQRHAAVHRFLSAARQYPVDGSRGDSGRYRQDGEEHVRPMRLRLPQPR